MVEASLSKGIEAKGPVEKPRIDIYGLWYRKYMEEKRTGGGVFSSKIEDFEVKWHEHSQTGSRIQLRHNNSFIKNVSFRRRHIFSLNHNLTFN